ncbi:MAG: hypothetical protein HDR03_15870 [Lachnospiraceae bacterium]|nr:hypothetical protein [Lachnospiraceae bacterium]
MEDVVLIILITLALLFCAGIVCGIISIAFLIKKKHPIISIILSFICWFGICIPIDATIGFFIGRVSMILMGIYCICVVVCSVKILKKAAK